MPHSPPHRQGPEGRAWASSSLGVVRTGGGESPALHAGGRLLGLEAPGVDTRPLRLQADPQVHARGGADAAQERSCGWAMGPSCPQEFLDHVAREAVEEEGQHEQPQQRQHDLDDEPLVPRADEVLDGLEGVEEPDEGGVGPAGGGGPGLGRERLPGCCIPSAPLGPKRPHHGPHEGK